MNSTAACVQGAVGPAVYRRVELKDLVTVTVLKLQSQDHRWLSTAELINSVEQEVRGWAISNSVLTARRLRKKGTRGIRLGEIADIRDHLVDGSYGASQHDPTREAHIAARATHTLGMAPQHWCDILAAPLGTEPRLRFN